DRTNWRPDILPVHTADDTDERFRSGKDVVNVDFLIDNFWPIAFNKTHIVCARIEAQLPEPSCIKRPIRWNFTPVCALLVKMLHAWVFRQLRHECSPLSQLPAACKFVGCNRPTPRLAPASSTTSRVAC